jgi:glycosyltransferase involved in cell wall biosynthesis
VKLALLGPAHPLRGGIAYYLALLYRELRATGHEVTFIGFRKQYPERVPNLPLIRKLRFPGSDQLEGGAASIEVPNQALFVPWNPWSWWRTARAVARSGAGAVVLKWWIPFFGPGYWAVAWLLRHFARVRVIAILDNVIPHESWPLGRLITRVGLGQMDAYIAQSKVVESDLFTLLPRTDPGRVRLVPHPTYDFTTEAPPDRETARGELGISESRVLLFFGFIKAYKGLMVLLDAVPRLRALFGDDDFRLLVVGDFYEDSTPYRQRIAELGIADRLTLVDGYLPNEDVPRYFTAADLVVLPYLSATQSGIIQIAYRYDRPVVTTRVGGLPEFVDEGETGTMVPPGDPDALAQAVARFFSEADREAMARAIAARREETSWARLIETIVELGDA